MILLIPLRLTLAVGTFALSVRPNGIRKAAKEAWKLWNLQIH